MSKFILPLVTYLAFIIEGTVIQTVTPEHYGYSYILIPHFSFVFIVLMACYLPPRVSLIYALIFGLLTDLMYTDLIGIYMFSTALVAYLITVLSRYMFSNFLIAVVLSAGGVAGLEFLVYGLNTLVGVAHGSIQAFMYDRLIGTLILNMVFTILLYYPFMKLLRKTMNENG
ncbi:cell-shape determining protein [Fictibacillus macauensis ZFHKF-1]|uniref:Cell-shape determining protein n=1 Tax=Fictibacillus macauensis ZFHKF-1 TaxID=1196324 RepID=I8UEK6_9BACL|nr:rod shape-determining protein MreD [Fictibacillus macauensis]EIT85340.1 cell-shape determining protein [Fictibacillus macauensis ZFHKF-1]